MHTVKTIRMHKSQILVKCPQMWSNV